MYLHIYNCFELGNLYRELIHVPIYELSTQQQQHDRL
jgi:hypothetical protein